uniref:Interferon-related developmental regulator 1 n=1 Tax=Oncorhynchus tshawytscha TaxID=74940 RepID=A0A8C8CPB3_ONCTS
MTSPWTLNGAPGVPHGAVQPFSDEDASIETLSHCSSFSDAMSVADEGGEAGEETAQEDLQYKLNVFIDSTVDKSAKTRQGALDGLKAAMATRILYEFISDRRMTITDSIERCLKKGTPHASLSWLRVEERLTWFMRSYVKEDGSRPSLNPQTTLLHTNALLSWALLLTICTGSQVKAVTRKHLTKLPRLLENDDVNMRIAAGETIALLFELARDMDPAFEYDDWEPLCDKLNSLATDCNKHRAKTDKRKQRSVFRDVLKAVEERDFQTETIRFSTERMTIDSWVRKRTYDAFREFVGSGMNYHLQANEFIRGVFELGPPVLVDTATLKSMKISRFEMHLYNAAAFKARTKARNKFRDEG